MSTRVLLVISLCIGQVHAVRQEEEVSLGVDTELSTQDVKSEMARLKTELDQKITAYHSGKSLTTYNNLLKVKAEAEALINQNKDKILELQNNFVRTFDEHAKSNEALAKIKDQVDAADAALKEEARRQQAALEMRKASMSKLKRDLSGVVAKINGIVGADVTEPSVSDVNQAVKQTDLVEKSLSSSLNSAKTAQTGIVARAQAMKGRAETIEDHQQMVALGQARKAEVARLAAQLQKLKLNDYQFYEDSTAVNMDIENAERLLAMSLCRFGQFSNDGNGHTGCRACEQMKTQLVEDNFGDLASHWNWVSKLTGRKTLAELLEALTYTSEPGATSYGQCVPKLCCGADGVFAWIPPNALTDKFACPSFMPTEDKSQCGAGHPTLTTHSDTD